MVAVSRRRKADLQKTQNRYDAAGQGRRTKGWQAPTAGPNRALAGLQTIRNRSQDAIRNDWSGKSSSQKWTTALVGVGITPRWEADDLNKLFARFGRAVDADGVLDYFGMQALAVREWFGGGEVFCRRRWRPTVLGLPVPVQAQLLGAEFVPLLDATAWPGLPVGNEIRQGIEFNRFGVRVAYWMYREHPGDKGAKPGEDQLVRVPARDVVHMYEVERAGQIRGVSGLVAVLMRLRASGDFEDATLDRQKLANLFVAFIRRAMPTDLSGINIDPDTGLPTFYDRDGAPMVGLEPGITQELMPGEDVTFANPPGAGVDFSDYLRSTQLGTAAGQGLPYELMTGDIKDVSDRAMRIVINEFRRYCEQRQWHMLIPQFCQRIVEWFAEAAVLGGAIPVSRLDEAKEPEHSPHGWEYIHPVQDVEGKILAIDAGLTSRDREITRQGNDPRKIDAERKAAKVREDELGLTPEPPVAPSAPPSGQKPEKDDEDEPKPDAAMQLLFTLVQQQAQATQSMLTAFTELMARQSGQPQALAPAAQAPAAPVFQIHNHVPQTSVHVEPTPVHIEPAQVTVNNSVEPTPVHIEPAQVTVNNEVPAAEVTVNLPARKTEMTVDARDERGRVLKTTQIETDAEPRATH